MATSNQQPATSTRQRFEQMIFQRGVFENQAKAIMDYAIPLIDAQYEFDKIAHKIDWNGLAEGYPDPFYSMTFQINIKPLVVLWIEENLPQAWFRSMFI
jgi:hypothetical protein